MSGNNTTFESMDPSLLVPSGACPAGSAMTTEGGLLLGFSLISAIGLLAVQQMARHVYGQLHANDVLDDAFGQRKLKQFGASWMLGVFFLSLGLYIAGGVVDCSWGCSSYAADCGSISCTVANHISEGYVILGLLLLIQAVLFVQSVNDLTVGRMKREQLKDHATCGVMCGGSMASISEWLMRAGFILTVITGLVPAPSSKCGLQPESVTAVAGDSCFEKDLGNVHTIGINLGMVVAIAGTLLCLFGPRYHAGKRLKGAATVLLENKQLLAMFIIVVIMSLLGIIFLVLFGSFNMGQSNQIDFCMSYNTKEACLGQELPKAWFEWASQRKRAEKVSRENLLTTDGWQCEWNDWVSTTGFACTKMNCNRDDLLITNKKAILFEFLGLVYGVYGIYAMVWIIDIIDQIVCHESMGKDLTPHEQDGLGSAAMGA